MAKSKLTLEIECQAINQFSKFGVFLCPEVTFQRPWVKNKPEPTSINDFNFNPKYTQVEGKCIKTEIVDLLESNSQKGWVCYEIKISKSDFHSKAIKSFVGNYNYYLMPVELYNDVANEIPKEIGVYVYQNKYLKLVKKARAQKLIDGIDQQLSYGMIRALSRERDKQVSQLIMEYVGKFDNYIDELDDEYEKKYEEYSKNKNLSELKAELDVLADIKFRLKRLVRF